MVQNTGRLSRNNPPLSRYLASDYFRRKDTKPVGKNQLKSFTFSSLLFYMEEKRTRFVESSDVKKLVANSVPAREDLHPLLVPESTKKSTKYAVNVFEDEESYE